MIFKFLHVATMFSAVAASILDCSSPVVICCCRTRPSTSITSVDRVSVSTTTRNNSDRLRNDHLALARSHSSRDRVRQVRGAGSDVGGSGPVVGVGREPAAGGGRWVTTRRPGTRPRAP